MHKLFLILSGCILLMLGMYYGLFAGARVGGNIDFYDTEIRQTIDALTLPSEFVTDNLKEESRQHKLEVNLIGINGLVHLTRGLWNDFQQTALILLAAGVFNIGLGISLKSR